MRYIFLKIIINHGHRRASATGEAFDEFHGVFAVRADRYRVGVVTTPVRVIMKIDLCGFGDGFLQLIASGHCTGEGAADPDMLPTSRMAAEHRVEGDQLVNIDGLKFELGRDPTDGFVRK